VGCPLQPDLVNTSCSVDCAPDAVLALWEGGPSDPRTGVSAVLPLSELPTHEHLHPSQFRDARQSWLLNQGTRPSFLGSVRWSEMARQLRLECQDSVYDLVSGRNAQESLFFCSKNRAGFLESLGNAVERQAKDFCGLLRSNHPCNREEGEKILRVKNPAASCEALRSKALKI